MLKARKGEKKSQTAVRTEMTKMKSGTLHSGSKKGPKVTNPKQAIAIGLSEARRGVGKPSKKDPSGDDYMRRGKLIDPSGDNRPAKKALESRVPVPKSKRKKR